jgi:hypothetical protein
MTLTPRVSIKRPLLKPEVPRLGTIDVCDDEDNRITARICIREVLGLDDHPHRHVVSLNLLRRLNLELEDLSRALRIP